MKLLLSILISITFLTCKSQTTITPAQAKDHIGQTVTICDNVVNTYYAPKAKGQPTFLDFGDKYPNATFEVVIWADDDGAFSFKPKDLAGKNVCITGKLKLYRGIPEMIIKYSDQITIK